MKYCGREFSDAELEYIRRSAAEPRMTRLLLSQRVCQELQWLKQDGGLKDMSCRVALLRMQEDGLVQLPTPRHRNSNCTRNVIRTVEAEPQAGILTPVGELQ